VAEVHGEHNLQLAKKENLNKVRCASTAIRKRYRPTGKVLGEGSYGLVALFEEIPRTNMMASSSHRPAPLFTKSGATEASSGALAPREVKLGQMKSQLSINISSASMIRKDR
jgi:hypothetical protein